MYIKCKKVHKISHKELLIKTKIVRINKINKKVHKINKEIRFDTKLTKYNFLSGRR